MPASSHNNNNNNNNNNNKKKNNNKNYNFNNKNYNNDKNDNNINRFGLWGNKRKIGNKYSATDCFILQAVKKAWTLRKYAVYNAIDEIIIIIIIIIK